MQAAAIVAVPASAVVAVDAAVIVIGAPAAVAGVDAVVRAAAVTAVRVVKHLPAGISPCVANPDTEPRP